MGDHTTTVRLEGDSKSLEDAFAKSTRAGGAFEKTIAKTYAQTAKMADAQAKVAASSDKIASAGGRGQKALERLGFAAHQVVGQTASVNQAMQGVLATLGPWGIAIGAAVGIVMHFAEAEREAEERTKALTKAIEKQRREAQSRAADAAIARLQADANEAARETARSVRLGDMREEKRVLEETIAIEEGRGNTTTALESRLAEIKAEELRTEASILSIGKDILDRDEAAAVAVERKRLELEAIAVLRDNELKVLRAQGEEEKKQSRGGGRKGKTQQSAEFLAERNLARFGGAFDRGASDTRDFEAGRLAAANDRIGSQLQRGSVDPKEAISAKERERDATLRLIEVERARAEQRTTFFGTAITDHEAEISRIEAERAANEDFYAFKENAMATEIDKIAVREDARQAAHEFELARIAEEQAAEEQKIARINRATTIAKDAAGTVITGILATNDARKAARNAALAQGKTEAEAARAAKIAGMQSTASTLENIRNVAIVKALEQGAMAIASFAMQDYVGGGLHLAAAAAFGALAGGAGAGASALNSRATSLQRADSQSSSTGGSGSGRGSRGGSGGGGGGSPGSDSPIPGSPGAGPGGAGPTIPSTAPPPGGATGRGLQFNGPINLYGTPHREFLRMIDEGLETEVAHTRRRAGS